MGAKKLVSIIGILVLVVVALVLKFVVLPKMELSQKKKYQWEDARPDIKRAVHQAFGAQYGKIFPKENVAAVEDCVTDKLVVFLNHSGCDAYYLKTITTKARALKKQKACLKKVGFEAQIEKSAVECSKQHLPKHWDFDKSILETEAEAALKNKISNPAKRKAVAKCVAERMIAALNESDCSPVKKDATKLENLFQSPDDCFKSHPKLSARVDKDMGACVEKVVSASPAEEPKKKRTSRRHRHRR